LKSESDTDTFSGGIFNAQPFARIRRKIGRSSSVRPAATSASGGASSISDRRSSFGECTSGGCRREDDADVPAGG
jgi:hypothetical protein